MWQLRTTPIARWKHSKTKAFIIKIHFFLSTTFLASSLVIISQQRSSNERRIQSWSWPDWQCNFIKRLKILQLLSKGKYFSKQKAIYKMKHSLSCHVLQTNKLSDTFYKVWELLFLDNHSHDYVFLCLLLLILYDFQPDSGFKPHYIFKIHVFHKNN